MGRPAQGGSGQGRAERSLAGRAELGRPGLDGCDFLLDEKTLVPTVIFGGPFIPN